MSSIPRIYVKICGITNPADLELAIELGADAVGFNLVAASKRYLELDQVAALVEHCGGRVRTVAVVADLDAAQLIAIRQATGVELFQLHGSEPQALLAQVPGAFKAVRVGDVEDVERARRYPGDMLLIDAKVAGTLGGSGQRFDWELIRDLVRERRVIVAGGLTPENVAAAVVRLAPYGVDVASGVEQPASPRRKDAEKMRRFIERAREASLAAGDPSGGA